MRIWLSIIGLVLALLVPVRAVGAEAKATARVEGAPFVCPGRRSVQNTKGDIARMIAGGKTAGWCLDPKITVRLMNERGIPGDTVAEIAEVVRGPDVVEVPCVDAMPQRGIMFRTNDRDVGVWHRNCRRGEKMLALAVGENDIRPFMSAECGNALVMAPLPKQVATPAPETELCQLVPLPRFGLNRLDRYWPPQTSITGGMATHRCMEDRS